MRSARIVPAERDPIDDRQALLADIRAIVKEELARALRPRTDRTVRAGAEALVQAIATAARGTCYAAGELYERRLVDEDLRRALEAHRINSPLRLGKRLEHLTNRVVGGVAIRRVGRDSAGAIWACELLADSDD